METREGLVPSIRRTAQEEEGDRKGGKGQWAMRTEER